jgi:hypothetical protein
MNHMGEIKGTGAFIDEDRGRRRVRESLIL